MKKIIAVILSIVLVVTCSPVMVSAKVSLRREVNGEYTVVFSGDDDNYIGYEQYCDNYFVTGLAFEGTGDVIFKGSDSFYRTGIKELYLPANVRFEGWHDEDGHSSPYSESVFANCFSLEKVTIACSDLSNTYKLFYGCSNLKTVDFVGEGQNLKVIEHWTFYDCQSLSHISLPPSVEVIGIHSFSGCENLKNIYIPQTVTDILTEALGYINGCWCDNVPNHTNDCIYPDFTIYGHKDSAAESYAKDIGLRFIPVDTLTSESITYTQSVKGNVGEAVPVTVSVLGYPDKITTKDSICATTIAREDAEIVTTDTGEVWTFDVTPYSETEKITLTASYCGEDITVSKDIEVVAEAPAEVLSPVSSAKTVNPAVTGSFAQVAVTVSGKADKIRFVSEDSATTTYIREDAKYITDNKNGTETWLVNVSVRKAADNFTIYASYAETGWISKGLAYTLESKAYNTTNEVKAVSLPDGEDGVIYCGVNTLEIVTSDDTVKVQLMKDSNTWTFSEENATYTDENGVRKWTLKMNFSQLGDQIYNIRVRNTKSAFVTVDQLPVTVYAD